MKKFCAKCGKELTDEVVICPGCGCSTAPETFQTATPATKKKRIQSKWIVLSAVALLVVVVLGVLFLPRNVKLDDMTAVPTQISCILKFGLPDDITHSDDYDTWIYRDVKIHNVHVDRFNVYFERSDDSCYRLYCENEDEFDYLTDRIDHFCEFDRSAYGFDFDYYSYKNAEVLVFYDNCSFCITPY